jgi:hypothetical protein
MPWVRFDDLFTEHPKIAELGGFGIALQVAAVTYCNRNLTDGFVPRSVVPWLVSWERVDSAGVAWTGARTSGMQGEDLDNYWIAAQMVAAGVWHDADTVQQCPRCAERWSVGKRHGYYIHDYLEYQASRDAILRQREAARNRTRRFRARRAAAPPVTPDVMPNFKRSSDDVTPDVTPTVTPNVTPPSHPPHSHIDIDTHVEDTLSLDVTLSGSRDTLYGEDTFAPSDSANRSAPPPASPQKPRLASRKRQELFQVTWDERAGFTVSQDLLALWASAYPAVDVALELTQAHAWAVANPEKRKKNWRRFLTNWMAREQERGGSRRGRQAPATEETLEERAARHARDLRAMRAAGRLPPLPQNPGDGNGDVRGPPASAR